MKVAIQGQLASFHDQAAHLLLPNSNLDFLTCHSFKQVFEAVQKEEADFGVVATYNFIHGTIEESTQLICDYPVEVLKTIDLPVHQCLVGFAETKESDITDVFTHAIALTQVKEYLEQSLPQAKIHLHHDTAGSVFDVKQSWQLSHAAIASEYAANYYKMHVISKDIQKDSDNFTRFSLFKNIN